MHFGYLTGTKERSARIWQNIDDSLDYVEIDDVPTLTINSQPTYMFSGGHWTLSKVFLSKTQAVTNNGQQFHYTREINMNVADHPIQQLYRVLPDGTPVLRLNRILHQNQVVKSYPCSLIQVSAILPPEVMPKNVLALPQHPVPNDQAGPSDDGGQQGQ